jgi:hypothetical protein
MLGFLFNKYFTRVIYARRMIIYLVSRTSNCKLKPQSKIVFVVNYGIKYLSDLPPIAKCLFSKEVCKCPGLQHSQCSVFDKLPGTTKCDQTRHTWRQQDIQHNDIEYNDTKHNGLDCDTQHNNTRHKCLMSLGWVSHFPILTLNVIIPYEYCHYAVYCYAECRSAECRGAQIKH